MCFSVLEMGMDLQRDIHNGNDEDRGDHDTSGGYLKRLRFGSLGDKIMHPCLSLAAKHTIVHGSNYEREEG